MKSYPYWHVDAFTLGDAPLTGNQAAVMVLDHWLGDEWLARIAAENNFAETAFLVPDTTDAADWELRWFTPATEVRLCGHATLASGHTVLAAGDTDEVRFRTRQAGILTVSRCADGYDLALPAIPTVPGDFAEAVALVGGDVREVRLSEHRYALLVLPDEASVRALQPDLRALAALGDWQFICTAPGTSTDVVSRVFVPGAGVDEDSFTGSAHAVLTPYWTQRLGQSAFSALQASARGGAAHCRLNGAQAVLTGRCATVVEGTFRLPG